MPLTINVYFPWSYKRESGKNIQTTKRYKGSFINCETVYTGWRGAFNTHL